MIGRLFAHSDTYRFVQQSRAWTRALIRDGVPAVEALLPAKIGVSGVDAGLGSRGLAARLSGRDEVVSAAVASSLASIKFFAQPVLNKTDPVDVVAGVPGLAAVLAERGFELAPLQYEAVLAAVERHPMQVDNIFVSLDMVKLVAAQPAVVAAMERVGGLGSLLADNAAVRGWVRMHPQVLEAVARGGQELVSALGAQPALVSFLAADSGQRVQTMSQHRFLVSAIRANRAIMSVLTSRRSTEDAANLWAVLAGHEALTTSVRPEQLRALAARPALVRWLSGHRVELSGALWREVLSNARLLRWLDSRRQGAQLLFFDPAIRDMYSGDPDLFTDALSRIPLGGSGVDHAAVVTALEAQRNARAAVSTPARPARGSAAKGSQAAGEPDKPHARHRAQPAEPDKPHARHRAQPAESVVSAADRWWVTQAGSSEELRELLATRDRLSVVRALSEEPHLLALFGARPDIVAQLIEDPERIDDYRFGVHVTSDAELADFERAFGGYVLRHDLVLDEQALSAVRGQARISWSQVRARHYAAHAEREQQRHARLAGLKDIDPQTWQMSGRILYGNGLGPDDFPAGRMTVLRTLASNAGEGGREQRVALHAALHAHLDGGDQGVTFTYLLNADAQVDIFVYAVSSGRSGNKYRWGGGAFQDGPLPIGWVEHDAAFQQSHERLAAREQIPAPAGGAPISVTAQLDQPRDPLGPLRQAVLDYYEQRHKTDTTATARSAPAGRAGQHTKNKPVSGSPPHQRQALDQAASKLHDLGLGALITPTDPGASAASFTRTALHGLPGGGVVVDGDADERVGVGSVGVEHFVGAGVVVGRGGDEVAAPKAVESTTVDSVRGWIGDMEWVSDGAVLETEAGPINCGPATMVVFDRLSGIAGAGRAHPAEWTPQDLGEATGLELARHSSEEIAQWLSAAGPQTHTVVAVRFSSGDQHSFNAYFDGEHVYALDGQRGTVEMWPPQLDRDGNRVQAWFMGIPHHGELREQTDVPTRSWPPRSAIRGLPQADPPVSSGQPAVAHDDEGHTAGGTNQGTSLSMPQRADESAGQATRPLPAPPAATRPLPAPPAATRPLPAPPAAAAFSPVGEGGKRRSDGLPVGDGWPTSDGVSRGGREEIKKGKQRAVPSEAPSAINDNPPPAPSAIEDHPPEAVKWLVQNDPGWRALHGEEWLETQKEGREWWNAYEELWAAEIDEDPDLILGSLVRVARRHAHQETDGDAHTRWIDELVMERLIGDERRQLDLPRFDTIRSWAGGVVADYQGALTAAEQVGVEQPPAAASHDPAPPRRRLPVPPALSISARPDISVPTRDAHLLQREAGDDSDASHEQLPVYTAVVEEPPQFTPRADLPQRTAAGDGAASSRGEVAQSDAVNPPTDHRAKLSGGAAVSGHSQDLGGPVRAGFDAVNAERGSEPAPTPAGQAGESVGASRARIADLAVATTASIARADDDSDQSSAQRASQLAVTGTRGAAVAGPTRVSDDPVTSNQPSLGGASASVGDGFVARLDEDRAASVRAAVKKSRRAGIVGPGGALGDLLTPRPNYTEQELADHLATYVRTGSFSADRAGGAPRERGEDVSQQLLVSGETPSLIARVPLPGTSATIVPSKPIHGEAVDDSAGAAPSTRSRRQLPVPPAAGSANRRAREASEGVEGSDDGPTAEVLRLRGGSHGLDFRAQLSTLFKVRAAGLPSRDVPSSSVSGGGYGAGRWESSDSAHGFGADDDLHGGAVRGVDDRSGGGPAAAPNQVWRIGFDEGVKELGVEQQKQIKDFAAVIVDEAVRRYAVGGRGLVVRVEGGGNGGRLAGAAMIAGWRRARAARNFLEAQVQGLLRTHQKPAHVVTVRGPASRGRALAHDTSVTGDPRVDAAARREVIVWVEEAGSRQSGIEVAYRGGYLRLPPGMITEGTTEWYSSADGLGQQTPLAINHRHGLKVVIAYSGTFQDAGNGARAIAGTAENWLERVTEPVLQFVNRRPISDGRGQESHTASSLAVLQHRLNALDHIAATSGGSARSFMLGEILPASEGWVLLNPHATAVVYRPIKIDDTAATTSVRHIREVPLVAVEKFMSGISGRDALRPDTRDSLQHGRNFAVTVAKMFQDSLHSGRSESSLQQGGQERRDSATELRELNGAMWLTYVQAAALAKTVFSPANPTAKHLSAIALRRPSLREVHDMLSLRVQGFLNDSAPEIRRAFEEEFGTEDTSARVTPTRTMSAPLPADALPSWEQIESQFDQLGLADITLDDEGSQGRDMAAPVGNNSSTLAPLDAVRHASPLESHGRSALRVGDYLDTMLLHQPGGTVNQHEAFGVHTRLAEFDSEIAAESGLLVLELRDADAFIKPGDLGHKYAEVTAIVGKAVAQIFPENPAAGGDQPARHLGPARQSGEVPWAHQRPPSVSSIDDSIEETDDDPARHRRVARPGGRRSARPVGRRHQDVADTQATPTGEPAPLVVEFRNDVQRSGPHDVVAHYRHHTTTIVGTPTTTIVGTPTTTGGVFGRLGKTSTPPQPQPAASDGAQGGSVGAQPGHGQSSASPPFVSLESTASPIGALSSTPAPGTSTAAGRFGAGALDGVGQGAVSSVLGRVRQTPGLMAGLGVSDDELRTYVERAYRDLPDSARRGNSRQIADALFNQVSTGHPIVSTRGGSRPLGRGPAGPASSPGAGPSTRQGGGGPGLLPLADALPPDADGTADRLAPAGRSQLAGPGRPPLDHQFTAGRYASQGTAAGDPDRPLIGSNRDKGKGRARSDIDMDVDDADSAAALPDRQHYLAAVNRVRQGQESASGDVRVQDADLIAELITTNLGPLEPLEDAERIELTVLLGEYAARTGAAGRWASERGVVSPDRPGPSTGGAIPSGDGHHLGSDQEIAAASRHATFTPYKTTKWGHLYVHLNRTRYVFNLRTTFAHQTCFLKVSGDEVTISRRDTDNADDVVWQVPLKQGKTYYSIDKSRTPKAGIPIQKNGAVIFRHKGQKLQLNGLTKYTGQRVTLTLNDRVFDNRDIAGLLDEGGVVEAFVSGQKVGTATVTPGNARHHVVLTAAGSGGDSPAVSVGEGSDADGAGSAGAAVGVGGWAYGVKREGSPVVVPAAEGAGWWHERAVDMSRTRFVMQVGEVGDLTDEAVVWSPVFDEGSAVVVHHGMAPWEGADDEFPLRDVRDPHARVHADYADDEGFVHSSVQVLSVEEGFRHGSLPTVLGPGVPVAALREQVRAELWRLIDNSRRGAARQTKAAAVQARELSGAEVADHEQELVGQFGLFATQSARRGVDGHILGIYMGALLRGEDDEALAQAAHRGNEWYLMDAADERGAGAAVSTYSADGAPNSMAFANTALRAPVAGQRRAYDLSRINAAFVPFKVQMIDNRGRRRTEHVSVMIGGANLTPGAAVLVSYGSRFLDQFQPPSAREQRAQRRAAEPAPKRIKTEPHDTDPAVLHSADQTAAGSSAPSRLAASSGRHHVDTWADLRATDPARAQSISIEVSRQLRALGYPTPTPIGDDQIADWYDRLTSAERADNSIKVAYRIAGYIAHAGPLGLPGGAPDTGNDLPPTTNRQMAEPAARKQGSADEPTGVANRNRNVAPLLGTVVERLPVSAAEYAAAERTGGAGPKSGRLTLAVVRNVIRLKSRVNLGYKQDLEHSLEMITIDPGVKLEKIARQTRRVYPEVKTYLDHRDQPPEGGSSAAAGDNGLFVTHDRQTPHGFKVRFYRPDEFHPDPSTEPREKLVMTALDLLERGGYTLGPDLLQVMLPRYHRTLDVRLDTSNPEATRLAFSIGKIRVERPIDFQGGFSLPDFVTITTTALGPPLPDSAPSLLHDHALGVVLHEMMHWLHHSSHPRSSVDVHSSRLRPFYAILVRVGAVSEYSLKNPSEFVAEYGVGRLLGRRYEGDSGSGVQGILDQLYERLGGPVPEQPRPVHAPELTPDELASLGRRVRKLTGMADLTNEDIKAREQVLGRFDRFRTLDHRARLISAELTAGAGGSGSVTPAEPREQAPVVGVPQYASERSEGQAPELSTVSAGSDTAVRELSDTVESPPHLAPGRGEDGSRTESSSDDKGKGKQPAVEAADDSADVALTPAVGSALGDGLPHDASAHYRGAGGPSELGEAVPPEGAGPPPRGDESAGQGGQHRVGGPDGTEAEGSLDHSVDESGRALSSHRQAEPSEGDTEQEPAPDESISGDPLLSHSDPDIEGIEQDSRRDEIGRAVAEMVDPGDHSRPQDESDEQRSTEPGESAEHSKLSSTNLLPRAETTIEQIRPWLSQINVDVHGGETRSRMFNCGQATIAVFDRLSGRAGFQTAPPFKEGILKAQLEEVTGFAAHRASLEGIEAVLRDQGSGAHAVVFVARRGPNGKSSAHAFNAFFDGAEVYALDGRDNSIQHWPPNFDAGDYKAAEWSIYIPLKLVPPQHLSELHEPAQHVSPDDVPLTDLAHGTHEPADNAPTKNDEDESNSQLAAQPTSGESHSVGESAPRQLVPVPGDGWCLLYAVLVSAPPHYWPDMGSSFDARTQHAAILEQLTGGAAHSPAAAGGALGQAARALHRSVLDWVSRVDPAQLPLDVVESYRRSQEQMDQLEQVLPFLKEDELLARLAGAGVTEAHERWMSPQVLRQRYVEARVRELMPRSDGSTGAPRMSERDARALAESEVKLKEQPTGWELDDKALGTPAQFRYLKANNELPPLRQLDIDGLQTAVRETNVRRPLTAEEHQQLMTAVRNWQSDTRGWNTSYGETFPALVAHAFDIRLLHNVRTPGVGDVGPAGSDRVVGIFYNGHDHYDGAVQRPHVEPQTGTTSPHPDQSTASAARADIRALRDGPKAPSITAAQRASVDNPSSVVRDLHRSTHSDNPVEQPVDSFDVLVRASRDRYTKALNDLKDVLAQGELSRLGPATAEAAAANRDLRQLRPGPAAENHDGSGPPDPQIPERIGPKMLIGGLDVVEKFESEEGDAAFKFAEALVRSKGGDAVWEASRQRIEALLSDNALRPRAAGVLRGGRTVKVEVDLGNGRFLTIELELNGERSYLVFKEPVTGPGEDFEHTSDNAQTAVKTKGKIRRYFFFLSGNWTGRKASDSATFNLEYVADRHRSNVYADRQVSGTLTLREPATRFHGGIHATITSRLTGDSETTERSAHSINYHTQVVVPTRDVNDRGDGDLGSPFGVATTGRLNGSDVVTNLWLLQDQDGTATPNRASTDVSRSDGANSGRQTQLSTRNLPVATVEDFVRSPGMAAAFNKTYADSADQAMSEVLEKLDPADLQAHLHGMTNGQPREYQLTNGGRVQVFASIEPIDRDRVGQMMRKTGTLVGPEFHYGSELDTSQARRKQRGLSLEIPTPGRFRGQNTSDEFVGGLDAVFSRGKTIRSVTNGVQYRWRNTLKHPTAGEAWRGQARLLFVMHPPPPKKLDVFRPSSLWRSREGRPPNDDAGQTDAPLDSMTGSTTRNPQPATRNRDTERKNSETEEKPAPATHDAEPINATLAEVPVPRSLHERLKASFEHEWHKRITVPLNRSARVKASFKGALYEGRAQFDVLVEKQGPPEKYMNSTVWRPPRGIWGPRPPVERNSITQRKIWNPRALTKRSSDASHHEPRAPMLRGSQDALLTGLGSMYRVTNVDLHGFQGMVDAMGRQAYGGAKWNRLRKDGSSRRGDAASWYHLNRVRGALPAMTQQRALTHRETKASFVANIHELTYLREFFPLSSPGTELTTGYANTASRDKQNHGHGSLGEDSETLLGEGIFGLDQNIEAGDDLRAGRRESVVTKFDQRMAEYSGWLRIDGTIEGSRRFGTKRTVHESGLFPIQIAIPHTELAARAQNPHDLPPTFRRDWPDGYFGKLADAGPVEHKSDAPLAEPIEPAVLAEDEGSWLPGSLTRSGTENSLSPTGRGSLNSSPFRFRPFSASFLGRRAFPGGESSASSLPGGGPHGPSSADAPVESPIYDEPDSIALASPDDVTHRAASPVVGLWPRRSSLVPNTALKTLQEDVRVASFAEQVDDRTAPAESSTDDGTRPPDRRDATGLPPTGPTSPTDTERLARLRQNLPPLLTSGLAAGGQNSKRHGSAKPETHSPDSDGGGSEVDSSTSRTDTTSPAHLSRQVPLERPGSVSPSSLAGPRPATIPAAGLLRRIFQRRMSDPSSQELTTQHDPGDSQTHGSEHGSPETASPVAGSGRNVSRIGVPPPSPASVTGITTAAGPSRRATLDSETSLREQQPSFAIQGEMLLKIAALRDKEADADLRPDWQKSEEPKDSPSPPRHAALPSGHPYDMLIGLDPLTALSDAIHDDLRGMLHYASEDDVDGLSDAFGDRVLFPRATHQFGQEWSHQISVLGGAGHITVKVRLVRDEQAKYVGQSAKFDTDVTTDLRGGSAHSQRDVVSRVVGGRIVVPVPHGTVSGQLTHSHSTNLPYRLRDPKGAQKRAAAANFDVAEEVHQPSRIRMIDLHDLYRHAVVAHISYEKHGAARALTDIPKDPQPVRLTGVFSYPAHTDISADTVPAEGRLPGGDQSTPPDLRLRPEQLVVKIRPHQGPARVPVDAAATAGGSRRHSTEDPSAAGTTHSPSNDGAGGPTPKEDLIANHVLGAMSKDGIEVFGDKWPSVRNEIAEHLQANALQRTLRNYANGDVTQVALKSVPGGKIALRGRIDTIAPVEDKAQEDVSTGHQKALSVNSSNIANSRYRGYLQGLFNILPGDAVNISLLGRVSGSVGNETAEVHTQTTGTGLILREVGPPKAHVGTATVEAVMTRPTAPKGRSAITAAAQIDFMTREPQRSVRENMGTLGDHPKLSHDTIVGKITGGDNFRTRTAENLPKQLSYLTKREIKLRLNEFLGDSLIGGNIAKMTREETNLLQYGSWRITGRADVTDLVSPTVADKGASANVQNEIVRGQSRRTSSNRELGTRFEIGPRWGGSNSGGLLFGLGATRQWNIGKTFGQSSRVTANGKGLRPYVVYDGTVGITLTVHVGDTAHSLPASEVIAPILVPESEIHSTKTASQPSRVTPPRITAPGATTTSLSAPTADAAASTPAGAQLLTQEWGQDDWAANTIGAAETAASRVAAGLPVAGIAATSILGAPSTGPTPQAPSAGTSGRAQPSRRPPAVQVVHTTEVPPRSNLLTRQRMTRVMRALVSGRDGRLRQNDAGRPSGDFRPPADEASSGGTGAAVQSGALPSTLEQQIWWLDDQWGAATIGAAEAAATQVAAQHDESGRRS